MSNLASPFKSAEGERDYMAAYEATMRMWPPPLVILHCFFTSLTSWVNNIADFS
jgi:hypothetical protein